LHAWLSVMSVQFGQLVHTSFSGVGFRTLASPDASGRVALFEQRIVQCRWDPYDPRKLAGRSVYLLSAGEHCLFGWLYGDQRDDLDRSHVPLFLCYCLHASLTPSTLDLLFALLGRGPVTTVDRANPLLSLQPVDAPDLWSHHGASPGVEVPHGQRGECRERLGRGEEIDLFFAAPPPPRIGVLDGETRAALTQLLMGQIGPMAMVIVSRTCTRAARIADPGERARWVAETLASEVDDLRQAATLREQAGQLLGLPAAASAPPPRTRVLFRGGQNG